MVSRGHSAARVGTVETTVTRRLASQPPRSAPARTSARGAGIRQPPCRQASHISSHEASNATDRPARTRSPGPSGRLRTNSAASASTNAAAERWLIATPLGFPVEPEVKMIQASSSGRGRRVTPRGTTPGREVSASPAPRIAQTPASDQTSRARSSGSSTSTGT